MRRPQLENQLMLRSEIDLLQVFAPVEIPEVQLVAVFPGEQMLGHEAVLEHIRRAPLAGYHRVVPEMPPHVVGELLRSAIDLPATEHVKGFVIHQQDAAGRFSFGVAQRADVDPIWAAMDRVRTSVSRPIDDLCGLDGSYDSRIIGIGLRVEDMNARRA